MYFDLNNLIGTGAIINADVSNDTRWVADNHGTIWHRFCHHCASSNHGMTSNGYTGQNGCPSANRSPCFNGSYRKGDWILFTTREEVVGKSYVRADEYVTLNTKAVPKLYTRLHRDAVTDDNIVFNEDMGADIAVSSYLSSRENHDELPDSGIHSNCCSENFGRVMYVTQWNRRL